ncbi:hypothetical protein [Halobacillus trueperi]|uniref:hypothetical protein n=1 Tax=Halobacillus trueperi TaxID=156205 RepID=UPI0037350ADE
MPLTLNFIPFESSELPTSAPELQHETSSCSFPQQWSWGASLLVVSLEQQVEFASTSSVALEQQVASGSFFFLTLEQ